VKKRYKKPSKLRIGGDIILHKELKETYIQGEKI
jgi:hypothetical protein